MREGGDDVEWVGKALTAVGPRGFGAVCRRSAESGVGGGVGGGVAWGR